MEFIAFEQVLSFRILELESYLLKSSRPLALIVSYMVFSSRGIGGASAASNNDLPDRVIKKHGCWKSEKAKDTSCREDIQHQLLVTLNIGI